MAPKRAAAVGVIQQVKAAGIKLIVDYDDDLMNIPTGAVGFNALGHKWPVVQEILKLADMVWVSTDNLKKVYRHLNNHTVPNAVLPADIVGAPNPITKTVVWRGDFNQVEDLYAYQEWYKKISRKSNRFVWFGYMPTWAHQDHVEYKRWTSLHNYFHELKTTIKPNFVWKPMRDGLLFSEGKSNISKLEAICAGGVALTNFYNRPTWGHSFVDVDWNESKIFGAWEAGRDDILRNYNLVSCTDYRYKLLWSLFENDRTARKIPLASDATS